MQPKRQDYPCHLKERGRLELMFNETPEADNRMVNTFLRKLTLEAGKHAGKQTASLHPDLWLRTFYNQHDSIVA